MMLDDAGFESNEKITGREPAQRKDRPAEQLYDREVPLNGVSGHTLLHDWLDGEVDVMRASEVEGKSKVELWTRINAESEMLRHRDRSHAGTPTAMRDAKSLVQIEMTDVGADVARPAQSHLRIHIRPVHVHLRPVLMRDFTAAPDAFFEDSVRRWIGDH